MGGANQSTITPPASATKDEATLSDLRIHEDTVNGQVHIHDDTAGYKFATSTVDFERAWTEGEKSGFADPVTIVGTDGNNQPVIATLTRVSDKGVMDLAVKIAKAAWGKNYQAIKKVVDGSN